MGRHLRAIAPLAYAAVAFALSATTMACSGAAADAESQSSGSDLVGGARDLGLAAAGYLVQGGSLATVDLSQPACNATLIAPNVVVTAAHCVLREPDALVDAQLKHVGHGDFAHAARLPINV